MRTAREIVAHLATTASPLPALTWYGTGGERIELSGRVLANWAVKATGLLLGEADAGPGTRVVLDLPAHWRLCYWALGAWTAGATVVLPAVDDGATRPAPSPSAAEVVVTDRPEAHPSTSALLVAVPLAGLALRYPGPLPAGALDGAADLMTYPDSLGWVPRPAPGTAALERAGAPVATHDGLLDWARAAGAVVVGEGRAPRVLVRSTAGRTAVLATALAALAAGGSLVLVGDAGADLARLAAVEGCR